MSVEAILDRLETVCPGYTRSSGTRSLLKLVQSAVDILFESALESFSFIDPANKGFPPYLITSADTYRYDMVADNLSAATLTMTIGGVVYPVRIKRVNRVFIDVTSTGYDYDSRWIGQPYVYSTPNPYSSHTARITVAN